MSRAWTCEECKRENRFGNCANCGKGAPTSGRYNRNRNSEIKRLRRNRRKIR